MHRSALAAAVPGFFAQQLGEHAIRGSAFRQTVSMSAVRAGDVVINAQRFADADCNRFFATVEMCQPWHQGAGVKLIDLLFEMPDAHHLPVGAEPLVFCRDSIAARFRFGSHRTHRFFSPVVTGVETPDMAARTSNMQAKSYLVQPMPRAAVRNSLLAAVVGNGTLSCR